MSQITFLHAADLHLDSPYVGLKHLPGPLLKRVQESTFVSLQKLVNFAIKKKVDFVIFAGDLYDAKQRSLKAQIRFRNEMLRLEREGIQAYIIHGNHDSLAGDWIELEWPSNVHVFTEQIGVKTFMREGKHVANLYGFSYEQNAVRENMAVHYEKTAEDCYHIGILHGTISSNKDHVPYAPFQLSDLKNKGFDYWALGHIHQKQILDDTPLIVYPGNTQGRHRKETGEKGCYFVSIHEEGSKCSFIETCDIIWEIIQISVTNIQTLDDLIQHCREELNRIRKIEQGTFVHIKFSGVSEMTSLLLENEIVEEIIEMLQEGEEEQQNFVWISSYENQTHLINRDQLNKQLHFVGDLIQHFEQYNQTEQTFAPLFGHKHGRRFISPLEQEEKEMLLKEAEAWILNELLKSKK